MIRVDKRAANHRVFIDGKIVGEGEGPYEVSCGVTHSVKVGSRGRVQKIDVGCGAEVNVKLQ